MLEAVGDLWSYQPADARVITTNGDVAGVNGAEHAVMGRGVALQAARRYPKLPRYFGLLLKEKGNVPMVLMRLGNRVPPSTGPVDPVLVTMPVKWHWHERASIRLIQDSARRLVALANEHQWQHVVMPRPGCGNGHLQWAMVRPAIADILDDRFTVIDYEVPGHARPEPSRTAARR